MGLEAVGHFRPYTVKRRSAMFIKTCPALKKKKWKTQGARLRV
jgi:hypothetical protein